jgi:hypothetical protein
MGGRSSCWTSVSRAPSGKRARVLEIIGEAVKQLSGVRAPGHVEHRFRGKPNTHSDGSRTLIPGRSNSLTG